MATSATESFRVESPCIRNCALDEDDICFGCHRSIEEICAWGEASNEKRREILQAAARRGEQKQRG